MKEIMSIPAKSPVSSIRKTLFSLSFENRFSVTSRNPINVRIFKGPYIINSKNITVLACVKINRNHSKKVRIVIIERLMTGKFLKRTRGLSHE